MLRSDFYFSDQGSDFCLIPVFKAQTFSSGLFFVFFLLHLIAGYFQYLTISFLLFSARRSV